MQYPALTYISMFSTALPLLIGVYRWRLVSRELRILIIYLFFGLTVEILSMWFIKSYLIDLGLIHSYILIEFIFIMSIIICWQESSEMKRWLQVLLFLYILFWSIAKLTFEPLNGLYSLTASVSNVLLALCAGYTLFMVIGNRMQSLFYYRSFWILLSFILYYAGTLILSALQGFLIHYSREDIFLAISINWSLKIIFNILFTVGFLCPQTQQ